MVPDRQVRKAPHALPVQHSLQRIVVLGIGNMLWADEGFGVRCVEALQQRWAFDENQGAPVQLVDGGTQKRAFTYIDDGIDALVRIIANKDDIANGKIYNIGNPVNNYSVRELANMMLETAAKIPEYASTAKDVKLVETTSGAYYGKGYQDVQNRVPKITNTMEDLGWKPTVSMNDAISKIFEAYRGDVALARQLVD